MGYGAKFNPRLVMQSKAGTGFIVADYFSPALITAQTGHGLVERTTAELSLPRESGPENDCRSKSDCARYY